MRLLDLSDNSFDLIDQNYNNSLLIATKEEYNRIIDEDCDVFYKFNVVVFDIDLMFDFFDSKINIDVYEYIMKRMFVNIFLSRELCKIYNMCFYQQLFIDIKSRCGYFKRLSSYRDLGLRDSYLPSLDIVYSEHMHYDINIDRMTGFVWRTSLL